jgi:putative NADH-flavin reductase
MARSVLFLPLLLLTGARALTPSKGPVAVTGTTGKLGRQVIQTLVNHGYSVNALLRHEVCSADDAQDASPPAIAARIAKLPGVTLIRGDVTDRASLTPLVAGCTAVIAAHGAARQRKLKDLWTDATADQAHSKNVNYAGIAHLIDASRASGTVERIVRVTGKGETPWSVPSILINLAGSMAKAWNYEGEMLLRSQHDIAYTIVRPGMMSTPPAGGDGGEGNGTLALRDDGGDLKVTAIAHAQVADLCVTSLGYPNAARSTLTAMLVSDGVGAKSWAPLLSEVEPDRRHFVPSLLAEHERAVRLGGGGLVALVALATGAAGLLASAVLRALWGLLRRMLQL